MTVRSDTENKARVSTVDFLVKLTTNAAQPHPGMTNNLTRWLPVVMVMVVMMVAVVVLGLRRTQGTEKDCQTEK